MRHLLGGFLRETVEPHLANGADHIGRIQTLAAQTDATLDPTLQERIHSLRNWNQKASSLLPWVLKFAAPSDGDPTTSSD